MLRSMNLYYKMIPALLSNWAATFAATVLSNLSGYHTTNQKVTAVSDAQELLATALLDVDTTKAAYHAAIEARNAATHTLLENISIVANDIYEGNTTPSLISAAGLEPRATVRQKGSPEMPMDLLANPNTFGGVALKWSRNGNPKGTTFVIETSVDNANWSLVSTTTKTRFTAWGFEPGNTAYFRVYAQKNGFTSQPSSPAVIYLQAPSFEVEEAA